jgi:hypothetical protein
MNEVLGNSAELHDDYAEQVNLAVAEGRDDIIDALTGFAATRAQRAPAHRRRRPDTSSI